MFRPGIPKGKGGGGGGVNSSTSPDQKNRLKCLAFLVHIKHKLREGNKDQSQKCLCSWSSCQEIKRRM